MLVPALAGGAGTLELRPPGEPRSSLARRLARAWPLALLLAGLIGIAYWEDMQRTAELADIDAATTRTFRILTNANASRRGTHG
ncbi:transmembrane protein [Burkholderia pseudomallei]|nr:transmembrane protein [Burkholderia pseudomallei]